MTIDWVTILISLFGSLLGGITVLAGVFVAWGQLKEKVENQGDCLDSGKEKFEKYDKIQNRVESIEGRCSEREKLMNKNDRDHVEIFARLHSLEIGMAALPGQMGDMIDERFERFRGIIKSDMKSVFYEAKDHGKE